LKQAKEDAEKFSEVQSKRHGAVKSRMDKLLSELRKSASQSTTKENFKRLRQAIEADIAEFHWETQKDIAEYKTVMDDVIQKKIAQEAEHLARIEALEQEVGLKEQKIEQVSKSNTSLQQQLDYANSNIQSSDNSLHDQVSFFISLFSS